MSIVFSLNYNSSQLHRNELNHFVVISHKSMRVQRIPIRHRQHRSPSFAIVVVYQLNICGSTAASVNGHEEYFARIENMN